MRPLYLLFKITVFYIIRIYYKRFTTHNPPKKFKAKTIFTVNHASAFMDPWTAAEVQRPIVFFMTRGDIFKGWLRPILWSAHMLPIYRKAEDGDDAHKKNEVIFKTVFDIFDKKKSIFIFAEGYTDNVFVRSLKPVKKGAARLAFDYYIKHNWNTNLKVQAIGINYANPNEFRAEFLVSNSKPLNPLDYKALYLENKNKAITQFTRDIEKAMQSQIVYLKKPEWTPFFDQIFAITKKGIVHNNYDTSIPLKQRWLNMKEKAHFVNQNYNENDEKWQTLKSNLNDYFNQLKQLKLNDNWLWKNKTKKSISTFKYWLLLFFGLPLFLLGVIHNFIPYFITKRFVEKSFKRRVFWSGVKMIMGSFLDLLYNLPFIWLFYNLVYPSYWLGILYILTVPAISGIFAYHYANNVKNLLNFIKVPKNKIASLFKHREEIEKQIKILNLQ